MVADRQPVSRDLGPECVPAGLSSMRRMCHSQVLSQNRRQENPMRIARALACVLLLAPVALRAQTGPVIVVETTKGAFAFETYDNEAPKTVAHVVQLVRQGFYDGQRVHRALAGFVVQWGD